MKKALSLLLAVIMLLCPLSAGVSASAEVETSDYIENPFYTGLHNHSRFSPLNSSLYATTQESYTYNGEKYYPEGDSIYKTIRNALAKRQESVNVNLYSNSSSVDLNAIAERYFENATEDRLSICSTDGDYARWSVSAMNATRTASEHYKGGYYHKLTLRYAYYATEEQEKQATAKINSIVKDVRKKNISDYKALQYIHDYICDGSTYDYSAVDYPQGSKASFSSYGVLCAGKGVCQGYANAFYRICKELGYNVRFVSSHPRIGCHAWNLIQLDDKFYFVDCTWDDEIQDDPEIADGFKAENVDQYYYFLVDYDKLRCEDKSKQHTLYDALYKNDYYEENYGSKTSSVPYDFETATGLSTCRIALSDISFKYNGGSQKPKLSVINKLGQPVSSYSASFTGSVSCGRVRIKLVGNGELAGSETYRSYIIVPSEMTALSVKSGGRTSNSLYLKWSEYSGGATGYQLQQYQNGSWKTIKTIGNASSCKVTALSPSTTYKFRIRAYKAINNYNYYGAYSESFSTPTIPRVVSAPALSTRSKAITIKWKKVNCSGYQLQYSTSSSMKNAKSVSVSYSKNSKKISGLKKGRRYYVRLRAYKTQGGKKYYSAWSDKKSIKVK